MGNKECGRDPFGFAPATADRQEEALSVPGPSWTNIYRGTKAAPTFSERAADNCLHRTSLHQGVLAFAVRTDTVLVQILLREVHSKDQDRN